MHKIPHACFRYSSPVGLSDNLVESDLARNFESNLRSRFGNVRFIKKKLLPVQVAVIEVNNCTFSMCITKSRYTSGEWIMLVGYLDNRCLIDQIFCRKSDQCTSELRSMAHEVHKMLIQMPSVSAVRWYFETNADPPVAVLTPDDLPWCEKSG